MRHAYLLITAVFSLMLLGDLHRAHGEDRPKPTALTQIQPAGGVPIDFGKPGQPIKSEGLRRASERLNSMPVEEHVKWVAELERISDKAFDPDPEKLEKNVCITDFVRRISLAFDGDKWNAPAGEKLLQRAQTFPVSENRLWFAAFEALLKKDIPQAYAVPLALIPVDALHDDQKYSVDRGKKYLARLKQLTAEDVTLWREQVDTFNGNEFDAAVNLILLDAYFDQEKLQRDKLRAAIAAQKK
jgi:hypothetical protein